MLILGRRPGESILIDGGIKLIVVACDRHGVRLGIEAPSHVKILRGEIADQVAQANLAAAAPVAAASAASWLSALGAPQVTAASTGTPSAEADSVAPAGTDTPAA
ncbi:MAG: carbon storage regulator [Gemmatimonadetes bacterium]|nr:carbon storage regulator [Gemmatimonadota bacterium]